MRNQGLMILVSLCAMACGSDADEKVPPSPVEDSGSGDSADTEEPDRYRSIPVEVTLDGEAVEDVLVTQPGRTDTWRTGSDGRVVVPVDQWLDGELYVVASHSNARTEGERIRDTTDAVVIELDRLNPHDNIDYLFQDPGSPDRFETTATCSHCHRTMVDYWWDSAHRTATSNPLVQDLYAGTAHAYTTQDECENAGGQWWMGLEPGTRDAVERCYIGSGVLPLMNADCGTEDSCDESPENSGGCADCHAPGIDGEVGGRDLLEATGVSYEAGVHCDVCHSVESVDVDEVVPGVGGRLKILRPSEPPVSLDMGPNLPLTFGPYADVVNPRMGAVQREHFTDATLCMGCHEYQQTSMVPGVSVDPDRWPDGTIPVHTTYSELMAGSIGDAGIACQSCHMPPDPEVGNSADLGNVFDDLPAGLAGGWYREPGAVRRHTWFGPRHEEQRMIDLAATLSLETDLSGEELTVRATVTNTGPGHAIPTGEPLRSIILLVQAHCGDDSLDPSGGDVVPDFGGHLDSQDASGDWLFWPEARVGQRIRVVRYTGEHHDYVGYGPFGDGRFDAQAKGMPVEEYAGEATVASVADGLVTLDGALPAGDIAYRLEAAMPLPMDGEPASTWAGQAGFGFARIMVGADGSRNVPHYLAVDVASDNRLLPGQHWTSEHRFQAVCDEPSVDARLVYRSVPMHVAEERGWNVSDAVMAEASK